MAKRKPRGIAQLPRGSFRTTAATNRSGTRTQRVRYLPAGARVRKINSGANRGRVVVSGRGAGSVGGKWSAADGGRIVPRGMRISRVGSGASARYVVAGRGANGGGREGG